jgi:hypothetical protein
LALEKIEYKIELKIELNDLELKRLDYLLNKLSDPTQDAAEAIALLGKTAKENLENVDTYINGIHEVLGESFTDEQSQAFKDLLTNMPSEEELPDALSAILGDTNLSAQ